MNERNRYEQVTPEGAKTEQQEKLTEAMVLLERGIESILDSEGFARYLQTMARFHTYSFRNVLMILAQRPEATQVAGYKTWQGLGRQVRKGEKGMVIFVPHKRRIREQQEENAAKPEGDQDKKPAYILTGYGLGRVFDITQTDGEPLPEGPLPVEVGGESEIGAQVDRRLSQFLLDEGVRLTVEDTGSALGYYQPSQKLIALSDTLEGDGRVKTLMHEAAHFMADHRGQVKREDAETVAESSAYVALKHYGIDTGSYSFPYVARWAEDKAVFTRNLNEVQKVSAALIEGIEAEGLEE